MADSINNKKMQQNTYMRQLQQEKSARKRELMAQQQQDLIALRQYYAEENKNLDATTADAISHIRQETKEMVQDYADNRKQQQIDARMQKDAQRAAQQEENGGSSLQEASTEKKTIYNRQGQKKLAIQNYETKETDDFYRVQDRGSRISENNRHYVIEAYAPEHEKDNLRVSIQRNKAIVSGKRKFGDAAQQGNKKMSTHNFQTFREEFQFNRPVSHEGMTRERVGDYVRFTIPKLETIDNPDENT